MRTTSRHRAVEQPDPQTGRYPPTGYAPGRYRPERHPPQPAAPDAEEDPTLPIPVVSTRAAPPPAGLWQAFGPLAPYLMREGITDLFIAANGELWTDDTDLGLRRELDWEADEATVRRLAVQLIGRGGRHIDEATPFVDVRLLGGVRVHAVLSPISTGGTLLSIRVPAREQPRLPDLVRSGTLTPAQNARLLTAVRERTNVLITGAGGAGNTTRNL